MDNEPPTFIALRRVALPYEKISDFDKKLHAVTTEVTVLANDHATADEVAGLFETYFENNDVINVIVKKGVLNNELHHTLNTVADDQEAMEVVSETFDLTKPNHMYVVQRKQLLHDAWLSTERVMFFRDADASKTAIRALDRWVYTTDVLRSARADRPADSARRTRFPPGPAYHIVLSVVHPSPDKLHVDFDAGEIMEDYIGSFVDELTLLHNFTLKSQWLHLLEYDFQVQKVTDKSEWSRHWAARVHNLPLLLTRLEERAATHVSEWPTINLALYAVPCQKAPIHIYDKYDQKISAATEAFLSAKWGGVVIGNPTFGECREEFEGKTTVSTYKPAVRIIMGTFVAQLRELLGFVKMESIEGAYLDPLRSVSPRRWELDALLRTRTVEQLTSAELTLRSLSQLLGEISNIVINDDVGASIKSSVDSIEKSYELLSRGDLVEAYQSSQGAFVAAEAAFMDQSLLALLYFPDDQKYAIYIPLFLPIMFPVILSLKNLWLWMRGASTKKEKKD
ncbi:GPI transamidase component PIG-S [Eumeta japonica]|uniref:GPI transamidase component PIG-S n=1 Tax=Eumeta variegata TaxID=151549 RepID=A0A4C1WSK1_EUMVA|nr:GPI transamidase component PIG-S [Eumeta japonica]